MEVELFLYVFAYFIFYASITLQRVTLCTGFRESVDPRIHVCIYFRPVNPGHMFHVYMFYIYLNILETFYSSITRASLL